MSTQKLILASISPRRKTLMEYMGLNFSVEPSDFDEYLDTDRSPAEIALELGFGKADAVAARHPDAFVVGGDLIVAVDGEQLAKPADAREAKLMLQKISGRTHQAIGSVVVVHKNKGVHDGMVDTVDVIVKPIPEAVMDAYIATGDPYDKAGGYARLHPLLADYFSEDGDIHTLTGLCTRQLRELLEKHGVKVPLSEAETQKRFADVSYNELKIIT